MCIAVFVLALGIGLNTAIFSVVYGLLLKPLPVVAPGDLVYIFVVYPRQPDRPTVIAPRHYELFRDHTPAFTGVTAHWGLTCYLPAARAGRVDPMDVLRHC